MTNCELQLSVGRRGNACNQRSLRARACTSSTVRAAARLKWHAAAAASNVCATRRAYVCVRLCAVAQSGRPSAAADIGRKHDAHTAHTCSNHNKSTCKTATIHHSHVSLHFARSHCISRAIHSNRKRAHTHSLPGGNQTPPTDARIGERSLARCHRRPSSA